MRRSTRRLHTTMRVPEHVLKVLKRYAASHGRTPGAVIAMALKEWADAQEFPGIDYRWTPSGRRPHVIGTGLTVREMWWIQEGFKGRWSRIRKNYPHLTKAQVDAAVAYGKVYPEETVFDDPPLGLPVVRV